MTEQHSLRYSGVGQTYKMPYHGAWKVWTDADIARMSAQHRRDVMSLWAQFIHNRFAFYLPHCDGKDFINDRKSGLSLLTKGNQNGGTSHAMAWAILRSIRCNPKWMCFTHHGLEYAEFTGPLRVLIATWSWGNMAESVWPELMKLMPRYELGPYAPGYGDSDLFPEEKNFTGAKSINFSGGCRRTIKLLASKSELFFRVYTQPQHAFETAQFDLVVADEQMTEPQFDGVDERGRTRQAFQICFPMTGHKLKGRQDTGKSGWIYRKLYLGTDLKGHTLGKYKLWIDGVPDAIYSAESKKKAYQKWVEEPRKNRDRKAMREGEARYYGGFEGEAELVLENWDADHHVIPRFDIPRGWTLYRGIDHGRVRPAAVIWMAVTSWGDCILYREFYDKGKTIAQNVINILAACGNTRNKVTMQTDADSEITFPIYEEEFAHERYEESVLDGKSFKMPTSDRPGTLGQMYNDCGLFCTPADMSREDSYIELFQKYLEIDRSREHIMVRLFKSGYIPAGDWENWMKRRGGDIMGASRLYVFHDLKFFCSEIETWQNKGDDKEKPEDAHNHTLDACKFILPTEPHYVDTMEEKHEEETMEINEVTGY